MRKCLARAAAKTAGAVTYNTGRPCKNGHTSLRNTLQGGCLACKAEKSRRQRLDPERRAHRNLTNLRSRYNVLGIEAPTRTMPDSCECCGAPPKPNKRLALDHDHTTGLFRGWLCDSCNLSIGQLGDSVAALDRAARYLRDNTRDVQAVQ